jgi:hypothetical protein
MLFPHTLPAARTHKQFAVIGEHAERLGAFSHGNDFGSERS